MAYIYEVKNTGVKFFLPSEEVASGLIRDRQGVIFTDGNPLEEATKFVNGHMESKHPMNSEAGGLCTVTIVGEFADDSSEVQALL